MRKLSLVTACTSVLACSGPSDSPTTAAGSTFAAEGAPAPIALTALQQEGRTIYETMCWTCHGTAGRGDGPAVQAGSIPAPPSFHATEYASSSTGELERRFTAVAAEADPTHPHMQFVTSLLKPERFAAALSFIPALSYPPEIPGSALAGERLYDFRCVGCHGMDGRGDGPASGSLILVSPADFTTDTLIAAHDWDAVFARIREGGRAVHGSSMPPWGIVLSTEETWDLVAFLGTFQPGALSEPPWAN
jgi:mono/diheme cytochrome c family protein